MNSHDFTTVFLVEQTPDEAFTAITNVRGWWSENIEGNTDTLGAEFTYRNQDVHCSRMKITELVPGQTVVLRVLDNYFNFTEDQNEWTGTQITFEVTRNGDQTEVRFSHLGLNPEFECFSVCSNAWGFYINGSGSLRRLITTGEGQPNPKEDLVRR